MKTNRLVLISLCLILCWMLPVGSVKISKDSRIRQSFPLDMSKNSVDDMYFDCSEKMEQEVVDMYFKKEIDNTTNGFKNVWEYKPVANCANKKFPKRTDRALTKNHIQAICAYTSDYNFFYKTFNEAVRTKKEEYGSSFQYHSLHFWLTRAVQILTNNQSCHETYRRTQTKFVGNEKDVIRFGTFTSTSKSPHLTQFGKVTCFKINTCSGAFLKEYPTVGEEEQEVLIPPYEMFNITEQCKTVRCKPEGLKDCKTVYVLMSTGTQSDLNCKLAKETHMYLL